MKYYYINIDTKEYHILKISDEYIDEIKRTFYVLLFDKKHNCFHWTLNYDVKNMIEYPVCFENRGSRKEKIMYLKESELFNPDVERMIANSNTSFIPFINQIRRTLNLKNLLKNI